MDLRHRRQGRVLVHSHLLQLRSMPLNSKWLLFHNVKATQAASGISVLSPEQEAVARLLAQRRQVADADVERGVVRHQPRVGHKRVAPACVLCRGPDL